MPGRSLVSCCAFHDRDMLACELCQNRVLEPYAQVSLQELRPARRPVCQGRGMPDLSVYNILSGGGARGRGQKQSRVLWKLSGLVPGLEGMASNATGGH